ncbi:MAG: hypothetical protein LBI91_03380 [Spirochaetaceae bacterium]|jgi:hypothetical protein|nr:hypothetical protein [Spirochaetaceae bacterium]
MNKFVKRIAQLPLPVKQWGLFAAWVGGLVLAGVLLWGLTGSLRSRIVLVSVNRVLDRSGIPYRLEGPISALGKPGRAMQLGSWFTLRNAGGRAVVFPLMAGPNTASALALFSPEGKLESLIPLGTNAVQLFERFPAAVIQLYARRAEEANSLLGALPEGGGT